MEHTDNNMSKLHSWIAVERGAQRFREIIIYVSKKSERDPYFGATKLNKILYHADFLAFEQFGIPLTGGVYQKLPQGPAPRALLPVRDKLIEEGAIRIDQVNLGNGYVQDRTVALREPILDHFTPDEVALVDEVIAKLWNQTASEVSDASHDVRWKVLNLKDNMPYEFAYLESGNITDAEQQRTRELALQFGW